MNRYSYVMNNPTSFVDPLGLDGCFAGAEVPAGQSAPCDYYVELCSDSGCYFVSGADWASAQSGYNPGIMAEGGDIWSYTGYGWVLDGSYDILSFGSDTTGQTGCPAGVNCGYYATGGSGGGRGAPNNNNQQKTAPQSQKTMSCGGSLAVLGVGGVTTGAVVVGAFYAPEFAPEIYEGAEGLITILHLSVLPAAPLTLLITGAEATWQNCRPHS